MLRGLTVEAVTPEGQVLLERMLESVYFEIADLLNRGETQDP